MNGPPHNSQYLKKLNVIFFCGVFFGLIPLIIHAASKVMVDFGVLQIDTAKFPMTIFIADIILLGMTICTAGVASGIKYLSFNNKSEVKWSVTLNLFLVVIQTILITFLYALALIEILILGWGGLVALIFTVILFGLSPYWLQVTLAAETRP